MVANTFVIFLHRHTVMLWRQSHVPMPAKPATMPTVARCNGNRKSVEGPSGFPESGPAMANWRVRVMVLSPLDEQSPSRWSKTDIKAGWNKFSWQFTANHITRNWRYYLTRQRLESKSSFKPCDFDFDLAPFCVVDGGMVQPPKLVTHDCYVPEGRSGYQVILAVWEVGDTTSSFYNAIDVNWIRVPSYRVNGSMWAISIRHSISRRAIKWWPESVRANGEQPAKQTVITISDATQGDKQNWPFYCERD